MTDLYERGLTGVWESRKEIKDTLNLPSSRLLTYMRNQSNTLTPQPFPLISLSYLPTDVNQVCDEPSEGLRRTKTEGRIDTRLPKGVEG